MKINKQHYAQLKGEISKLAGRIPAHAKSLEGQPAIKDLKVRVRWDCLHASRQHSLLSILYKEGLNDTHIDTALRGIMRDLGFPEFA